MRCSGCGKKVSFRSIACPQCGSDTAKDKKKLVFTLSSSVVGGVFGIGVGGPLGAIIGMFLGGAGGTVAGLAKYGGERYLPQVDLTGSAVAKPVGQSRPIGAAKPEATVRSDHEDA
jgi:hypothetical protein